MTLPNHIAPPNYDDNGPDGFGFGLFGGTPGYWSAQDWISFHVALKKEYRKKEGDKIFLWYHHSNPDAPSTGSIRFSYPVSNPQYKDYFEKQGILQAIQSVDNPAYQWFGDVATTVFDITQNAHSAARNLGDDAETAADRAGDTLKSIFGVMKYAWPIILIIALIVIYMVWGRKIIAGMSLAKAAVA